MSRLILILGGTAEARELAAALHAEGHHVVTSLAGRVAQPRLPDGEVRIGGFGGPEKLAEWITANAITHVLDATHPFAERISQSAHTAAGHANVPLLRLERPGWTPNERDHWHWVDDLEGAAALLPDLGSRVFLTTGRQGLRAFKDVDAWFLVRCVDPPDPDDLPARHELLLDRGPYTLDGELRVIDSHSLYVVVTKDSGGDHTRAKLDAARTRNLPVIVVRRPPRPAAVTVADTTAALAWATRGAAG